MGILEVLENLQEYSEDEVAARLDSRFVHAVSEAVSLLIGQGEEIADLQNALEGKIPTVRFLACYVDLKTKVPKMVVQIGEEKYTLVAPAVSAIPVDYAWESGKNPPEKWKDEDGDAINYLVVTAANGEIDIGNWVEPIGSWFVLGLPCTVTHWMPLPHLPMGETE